MGTKTNEGMRKERDSLLRREFLYDKISLTLLIKQQGLPSNCHSGYCQALQECHVRAIIGKFLG